MDDVCTRCGDRPAPHAGLLHRRRLLQAAGAAGLATALPRGVARARGATPQASPSAGIGEPVTSQTRKDFNAEMITALGLVEGTPGGTYLDSNTSDIQTVMPFLAEEQASLGIVGMIFDSLTGGDPRTGGPAPNGLADWWEIAADGVTYTFHLNEQALWHDGQPVTADDVQFSFDALADPATSSAYTSSFLDTTASWRVVDPHTFEMVAKEPTIDFLYNLVAYIIPKHVWEPVARKDWKGDGGATGLDPARVVGSGPYKFKEWKPGESISLVRNDAYYDKVPYFDEYVMKVWPDQTAVVNAFLNGEIDATGLEPSDVAAVEGAPGVTVATYDTRGFSFIGLNLDPAITPFFQDVKTRQALMFALDRQSIVDNILLGYARVARGTQPVVSYAYAPDRIETVYDYDPAKARQLLADAGWADSDGDGVLEKDGKPLAFEYTYPSGSPTTDQIAAYVQDAWKAVGANASPKAMDFPALVDMIQGSRNFVTVALGFNWDATFIQDAMFGCDQYEGGFNFVKYCNPALDKINDKAKRTFDQSARAELLIEASNIVNDELPVLILHFSKAIVAYTERLQNYKPSTWGSPFAYQFFKA